MPKLNDERRKQWAEHRKGEEEFWLKIEAKYHNKQKRHAECRLCGEMVSAIEPDDVDEALIKHEKSHPEYAEWVSLSKDFSIINLREILHDHDCVFVKCQCLCGCQINICVADIPEEERGKPILCDLCTLYQGRGHVEHRLEGE